MAFSPSVQGMALVLLAAVLWGTTGTAQSAASGDLSASWVGALRLVFAGTFFLLLTHVLQRRAKAAPAPMWWPRLLLCGLCMLVYNLSFFAGLRSTGVGLGTAVALGSSPIWAGLLQAWLQRQWPPHLWWLGTGIGVVGACLMAWANPAGHLGAPSAQSWALARGLGLCLLAGFSYGCYAIWSQPLVQRCGVARVNAGVFGSAAVLALPLAWLLEGPLPQPQMQDWAVVAYLGLVATGVAYLLFSAGLRHISAATCVALTKFEPITAFVLSIAIVGEQPSVAALMGLALLLLGLSLVVHSEMRQPR